MENYWRALEDFDNYEISKDLQIRNKKTGRVLKPQKLNTGYINYRLCKDGRCKNVTINKLMKKGDSN